MKISFILVEPARPENIGAAARAIKTMGFQRLRLVNAEPSKEAWWVAHESGEILDQAEHCTDLAGALADVDFSIATTARRRLQRNRYFSPRECADALHAKSASVAHAALVFGRESSGLSGAELALCDAASRIPLQVEQPSLNLAQAVMLYAWELSRPPVGQQPEPAPASYPLVRQQLRHHLGRLGLEQHPNLLQWAQEGLNHCSDRDLGMLMQILRRLP